MIIAEIIGLLAKGKGAKFANVTYRAKRNNELARYRVILGAEYVALMKRDVDMMEKVILPTIDPTMEPTRYQAAMEVLNSRQATLTLGPGNNPEYPSHDVYSFIDGLPGFKVHRENGTIYVTGLVEDKVILEPGEPEKPVKSSAKTIEKRRIEKQLPSGRYRQFIIGRFRRVAANGDVLEIEAE